MPARRTNNQPALIETELPWVKRQPLRMALAWYDQALHTKGWGDDLTAALGRHDRFFLLTHLLHRTDAIHPWIYERCREVEAAPDGYLDLWARGHWKSSIITYAGAIQEILRDPEITIGIFSHTRPIAKAFLRQIKREYETNELLKQLYPDVLWGNPAADAPLWSEESGIIVRRASNPKEATVEAWGLVDGQPTGKHFALRIYDDVVTRESVTTSDQILKTTEAYELSLHLSGRPPRQWVIGTRYHYADTYRAMLDRGMRARIYPATTDGTPAGKPVLLTPEEWEAKKNEAGPYTIACQMLLNPLAGSEQVLRLEWIRTYEVRPRTLNVYILCDPADSKSSGSSRTAMAVIGVDAARNKYLLDGACHRMNLKERWELLKSLHKRWVEMPGVQTVFVGYEKYGMQTDLQHFAERMQIEDYSFDITELGWTREGPQSKDDRIKRLVPDLASSRFWWPYRGEETALQLEARRRGESWLIAAPIKRIDENRKVYDLTTWAVENEYAFFPATTNKDFLDSISRIYDMDPTPPVFYSPRETMPQYVED